MVLLMGQVTTLRRDIKALEAQLDATLLYNRAFAARNQELASESTRLAEEISRLEAIIEADHTMREIPVCNPKSNRVTFMDYRANAHNGSPQWALQADAYTNDMGIRETGGYIHVAMARQYGELGDKLIIEMDGLEFKAILVEWKGSTACTHPDGSMLELVVDTPVLREYNGGDNVAEFQKNIIHIYKIKETV